MVQPSVNSFNEEKVRIAPLGYLLKSLVTYPHPKGSDKRDDSGVNCNLHDLMQLKGLRYPAVSRLIVVLLQIFM